MKRIVIFCLVLLLCIGLIGCGSKVLRSSEVVDKLYYEEVGVFDLLEYEEYHSFWTGRVTSVYGKVETPKQAALCAEKESLLHFTEQEVYEHKPFEVYYDVNNTAWRVVATHHVSEELNGPSVGGGGVDMIIDEETGEVLSVWLQD